MANVTTPEQPTIYLVDDEPAIRKGFARLLRNAGWPVEAFGSCEEFLLGFDPQEPGCLVLDIKLPGMNGQELQRHLVGLGSQLPIIFITGHGDIPMCARAIKDGAVDFLAKPVDAKELFRAVGEAVERDRESRRLRADVDAIEQRLVLLTAREREVLAHVVNGKPNKKIAAELGTVEKTIKVHRARIMEKMQAGSLAELVKLAMQVGIGSLDSSGSGGGGGENSITVEIKNPLPSGEGRVRAKTFDLTTTLSKTLEAFARTPTGFAPLAKLSPEGEGLNSTTLGAYSGDITATSGLTERRDNIAPSDVIPFGPRSRIGPRSNSK